MRIGNGEKRDRRLISAWRWRILLKRKKRGGRAKGQSLVLRVGGGDER
jgi:hypothetical protein